MSVDSVIKTKITITICEATVEANTEEIGLDYKKYTFIVMHGLSVKALSNYQINNIRKLIRQAILDVLNEELKGKNNIIWQFSNSLNQCSLSFKFK